MTPINLTLIKICDNLKFFLNKETCIWDPLFLNHTHTPQNGIPKLRKVKMFPLSV